MARVLAIDDDPVNRLLIATILAPLGHDVVEAQDARSGLAEIDRREPDLVLLDLSLPGIDGWGFLRELRRGVHARVSVAIYTATSPDDAMRDAMRAYGVQTAVPKPCEPAELQAIVEVALTRARRRRRPDA